MKKFILAASLIALAACSSAPKEDEDMAVAADEQVTSAPVEPIPEPEAETKKASSTMADEGGVNMSGEFPDVEGTERSGATCKNGGEERMVSVIDTREGPCGVVYTKHSNKRTVAYAVNDMGYCDKVYDNIIGNLTNGGYDCGGAQPTAKQEEASEEESAE